MKKSAAMSKKSSVIRPGTGSGSRPTGGSTKTPTSEPKEKQTLDGRKPKGALK